MPPTVPFAFAKLIHRIQPTPVEVNKAKLHAITIRSRLSKSFHLKKFQYIGSHSRGTAIRAQSDLDLLALFSRAEAKRGDGYKSSTTFISAIRDDLSERYQQTAVRRDQQAVVVHFDGGSQPVDVVPAIFEGVTSKNWPLYRIPDGSGDWIATSPESHSKFLRDADEASGGKLKRVVQLLKFWRDCRAPTVPILSFHLELLLASHRVCVGVKSYAVCFFDALNLLAQRECCGIRDPLGISGLVSATKTEAQRQQALVPLLYSRDHALSARAAESAGDHREACRQWNIVFNGYFPGGS